MNPITLTLCKTPVVGIAMWLSSMCVTNRTPEDVSIDVGLAGDFIQKKEQYLWYEKPFLLFIQGRDAQHRLSSFGCEKATAVEIEKSPKEEFGAIPKMNVAVDLYTIKGKLIDHYYLTPNCPPSIHEDAGMLGLGEYKNEARQIHHQDRQCQSSFAWR